MVRYLLDTDILSNTMRPQPSQKLQEHLHVTLPSERALSAISLSELIFGALRVSSGQKYLPAIEDIATHMQVIAFDEAAAREHAKMKVFLLQQGTPIGEEDLKIASIALTYQLILVTRNTRHFSRVPTLLLENWIDN